MSTLMRLRGVYVRMRISVEIGLTGDGFHENIALLSGEYWQYFHTCVTTWTDLLAHGNNVLFEH